MIGGILGIDATLDGVQPRNCASDMR
jgi:hypothetical protein